MSDKDSAVGFGANAPFGLRAKNERPLMPWGGVASEATQSMSTTGASARDRDSSESAHSFTGATHRRAAGDSPALPKGVVLATAASGGSIATTRYLGRAGLEVSVVSSPALSPSAWSKHSFRSFSAPPESDTPRFLERLLAIGRMHPGQVLLATSDETAWLYTLHKDELSRYFIVNQPSLDTMKRLLDKRLFAEAITKAGLTNLPTWEPESLEHLKQLSSTLPYPVLIKPRTHVYRVENSKGVVVKSGEELMREYEEFVERESHHTRDSPMLPKARLPVLQQFIDTAKRGVLSVSGYLSRRGDHFVTRRCVKVLQRSQPVGVGVCFEGMPADPELSESVRALCQELGYFGLFEVEFLQCEKGWAPIDFNGRIFNQIGLDIGRGMPLPLFAFLEATKQMSALEEAVRKAQFYDQNDNTVFYDRFTLSATLAARRLTGRISKDELNRWRTWMRDHAGTSLDVAVEKSDWKPGLIHAVSEISLGLKAFPRFLKSIPRSTANRSQLMAKAGL